MIIVKKLFFICLLTILSLGLIPVCQASGKEAVILAVVNHSKEAYGDQVKSEVCRQFDKQQLVSAVAEKDLKVITTMFGCDELSKAEKPELGKIAEKTGVNKVVIVEILPAMIQYNQIILYQVIKAEATLRIRVYDAGKAQYTLREDIAGQGNNQTFLPYTSLGTKPAVLEAVHRAALIATEKINQELDNRI